MKASIIIPIILLTSPAFGEKMYEWRDPSTGKLMLGDRPPQGIKFWEEGARKSGEQSALSAEEIQDLKRRLHASKCKGDPAMNGIKIGMTSDDFLFCYKAYPDKINTTRTAQGIQEQWVYRKSYHGIDAYYFYFNNGILTAIQDN